MWFTPSSSISSPCRPLDRTDDQASSSRTLPARSGEPSRRGQDANGRRPPTARRRAGPAALALNAPRESDRIPSLAYPSTMAMDDARSYRVECQMPRASGRGGRNVGFMENLTTLGSALSYPVLFTDRLRLAVAAYLA